MKKMLLLLCRFFISFFTLIIIEIKYSIINQIIISILCDKMSPYNIILSPLRVYNNLLIDDPTSITAKNEQNCYLAFKDKTLYHNKPAGYIVALTIFKLI